MEKLSAWEDKFLTGIKIIDKKHKDMFKFAKISYDTFIEEGTCNIALMLPMVIEHLKVHFIEEEAIFSFLGKIDPDHISRHNEIINELEAILDEKEPSCLDIAMKLNSIIYQHLAEDDMVAFHDYKSIVIDMAYKFKEEIFDEDMKVDASLDETRDITGVIEEFKAMIDEKDKVE